MKWVVDVLRLSAWLLLAAYWGTYFYPEVHPGITYGFKRFEGFYTYIVTVMITFELGILFGGLYGIGFGNGKDNECESREKDCGK